MQHIVIAFPKEQLRNQALQKHFVFYNYDCPNCANVNAIVNIVIKA